MTATLRPLFADQAAGLDQLKQAFFDGHRRIAFQAPCGFGKCLGIGTPVLRFDGEIVPVESVRVGDRLMGPDGLPRNVLSTCRDRGQLFRIIPTKGEAWVCNDVHVLTLVNITNGRVVDVPLDEYLTKSNNFRWVHKLFAPPDGIDFHESTDPDLDPYWLGLWLGDGNKALRNIGVTKPDTEVRESCEAIATQYGLRVRTETAGGTRCPTYTIVGERGAGNPLLQKVRALASNGVFPTGVRTASRLYRQEFLAGVIDSDGYVHKGCCEVVQRNQAYADGIAFVARTLGLRVTVASKFVNGVEYKRLGISGDFAGIEMRIPRKKMPPRRQIKTATRTAFQVEPIGVGEYAGFELDGDGRFLLGDLTVTHNTVLGAHMVTNARRKGNRVTFCAPAIGLIDQTFERFRENGIDAADMGVLQGDHPWRRPHAPIQIATPQTIGARDEFPPSDLVILDEGHEWFEVYDRWLEMTGEGAPKAFILLSATPWSKGLGKRFTALIRPISMRDLIAGGRLSDFRAFAPSHPDLTGVKIRAGDYVEGELAKRMDQPHLVADVVSTWLARGNNEPTLCFATGRAHARNLADRFAAAGVPTAYIDANTPREERDQIGKGLADGSVKVVVNIGTCTRGIDWTVRCLIMARPTKSDQLYVQILGRVIRPEYAPGFDLTQADQRLAAIAAGPKPFATILDHSDNHLRLGMVTDVEDRHTELDMGVKQEKAAANPKDKGPPLPTECGSCGCLVPVMEPVCPACGYEKPKPQFKEGDGQLVEFSPGRPTADRVSVRRQKGESAIDALRRLGPEVCFQQIKWMQESRGCSKGWAAHRYRDLWGDWPARAFARLPVMEPCDLMIRWDRHLNIAWAAAKKREREAGEVVA